MAQRDQQWHLLPFWELCEKTEANKQNELTAHKTLRSVQFTGLPPPPPPPLPWNSYSSCTFISSDLHFDSDVNWLVLLSWPLLFFSPPFWDFAGTWIWLFWDWDFTLAVLTWSYQYLWIIVRQTLVARWPSKEMINMSDNVLRYSLISSVLGTEKVTTVAAESLNSMKLCVCAARGGGTVHLLLATAVCRLLVFPPPRSVPDWLTAAVEEEQSAQKDIDAFMSDR